LFKEWKYQKSNYVIFQAVLRQWSYFFFFSEKPWNTWRYFSRACRVIGV